MNTVLSRYQDNFPRHVLAVTRHLEGRIMACLQVEHGHRGLRLSFEPYISMAAGEATRLSSVADNLGVTRQAANAVVNELESLGYLRRVADPEDGRAKQIVLTPEGERLRGDGLRVAETLQAEYRACVGTDSFEICCRELEAVVLRLPDISAAIRDSIDRTPPDARFSALLPRLADYLNRRLMTLTAEMGHPGLKLSYAQVLTLIGRDGGRMQAMAQTHKVSKQAINAIATELQQLGYIERRPDPGNARQVLLHFTPTGLELIRDSVTAIDSIESELCALAGATAVTTLQDSMRQLYAALQPEPRLKTGDLDDLAGNLLARLGPDRARQLGELLIKPAP